MQDEYGLRVILTLILCTSAGDWNGDPNCLKTNRLKTEMVKFVVLVSTSDQLVLLLQIDAVNFFSSLGLAADKLNA